MVRRVKVYTYSFNFVLLYTFCLYMVDLHILTFTDQLDIISYPPEGEPNLRLSGGQGPSLPDSHDRYRILKSSRRQSDQELNAQQNVKDSCITYEKINRLMPSSAEEPPPYVLNLRKDSSTALN